MATESRRKGGPGASGSSPYHRGDVRVGAVLAIPAILTERGFDPARVLARLGIDLRLFDDPENRIPFVTGGRLLEECAALTRCPHFGLLVGQRFDSRTLGALGYLARNSRTVGDALHSLVRHLHVHDRGAVPVLAEIDSKRVRLAYTIYYRDVPATDQIYDAAMAIAQGIMRALCGPRWKPLEVMLSHAAPGDVEPFELCFGVRPRFNTRLSALVFARAWLDHAVEGADPVLHAILARAIAQIEASEPTPFAVQVRRALWPLVYSGSASMAALARLFGLPERTLRRRLKAEGTTVHQLLNEARLEAAQQLLRDTRLTAAEIATLLHYSGPAAFSRAFGSLAGISPSAWRARHRSAAKPSA